MSSARSPKKMRSGVFGSMGDIAVAKNDVEKTETVHEQSSLPIDPIDRLKRMMNE